MRSRSLVFVGLLAVAFLGCQGKSTEPEIRPPSDYLPRTSIANLISNLKQSYEKLNFEEYALLPADGFEFVFAPEDVGGPNSIPESWGKADELLSASHMFGGQPNRYGYTANDIKVTFTIGPEETTPLDPAWRLVKLTQIHLMVNTAHPEQGQLLLEVSNDQAFLYFVETPETDPYSGGKIWKIVRWEDKPIGLKSRAVESTSWGAVKGSFR